MSTQEQGAPVGKRGRWDRLESASTVLQRAHEHIAGGTPFQISCEVARVASTGGPIYLGLVLDVDGDFIDADAVIPKDCRNVISPFLRRQGISLEGDLLRPGNELRVLARWDVDAARGAWRMRIEQVAPWRLGVGPLTAWKKEQERIMAGSLRREPAEARRGEIALYQAFVSEHDRLEGKTIQVLSRAQNDAGRDVLRGLDGLDDRVRFSEAPTRGARERVVNRLIRDLQSADKDPSCGMIMLTRGGGSPAELAPFDDARLASAVLSCQTPVVTALGHSKDVPLVARVTTLACTTPTDGGRRLAQAIRGPRASRSRARTTGSPKTHGHAPSRREVELVASIATMELRLNEERWAATIAQARERVRGNLRGSTQTLIIVAVWLAGFGLWSIYQHSVTDVRAYPWLVAAFVCAATSWPLRRRIHKLDAAVSPPRKPIADLPPAFEKTHTVRRFNKLVSEYRRQCGTFP